MYESNYPPGVTGAMIDRAAGVYDEDEQGVWWDDEAGCWSDTAVGYCQYCGLAVTLNDDGLCTDCAAELAALAQLGNGGAA